MKVMSKLLKLFSCMLLTTMKSNRRYLLRHLHLQTSRTKRKVLLHNSTASKGISTQISFLLLEQKKSSTLKARTVVRRFILQAVATTTTLAPFSSNSEKQTRKCLMKTDSRLSLVLLKSEQPKLSRFCLITRLERIGPAKLTAP